MSIPEVPTRGAGRPAPYIVSGILIVIGIVVPLLIPIYARQAPALFGLPFFYWYQMLWVLIDSGLLWICFILVTREDRRRRDAIRSDPASAAHTRFGKTEGET